MGHEGRLKRKQRREENRKSKPLLEIWNNNIVKFIEQQNRLNDRLKTVQQNQVILDKKLKLAVCYYVQKPVPTPKLFDNYDELGDVIGPEVEVSETETTSTVAELQTNEQVLEECTEEDTEGSGDSEPEGTVDDPESTPEA